MKVRDEPRKWMFATGARQHMTKPPTMSIQRKSALRPRKDPVRRLECEIRVREGEKKKRGKRGGRRRAFFEHLGVAGEEKHVEQEVDVDGAEEEEVGDEAPELEAPEDGDGIEIHPHWRHDLRRQESPERGEQLHCYVQQERNRGGNTHLEGTSGGGSD